MPTAQSKFIARNERKRAEIVNKASEIFAELRFKEENHAWLREKLQREIYTNNMYTSLPQIYQEYINGYIKSEEDRIFNELTTPRNTRPEGVEPKIDIVWKQSSELFL